MYIIIVKMYIIHPPNERRTAPSSFVDTVPSPSWQKILSTKKICQVNPFMYHHVPSFYVPSWQSKLSTKKMNHSVKFILLCTLSNVIIILCTLSNIMKILLNDSRSSSDMTTEFYNDNSLYN